MFVQDFAKNAAKLREQQVMALTITSLPRLSAAQLALALQPNTNVTAAHAHSAVSSPTHRCHRCHHRLQLNLILMIRKRRRAGHRFDHDSGNKFEANIQELRRRWR
jgi:hypothetical protein